MVVPRIHLGNQGWATVLSRELLRESGVGYVSAKGIRLWLWFPLRSHKANEALTMMLLGIYRENHTSAMDLLRIYARNQPSATHFHKYLLRSARLGHGVVLGEMKLWRWFAKDLLRGTSCGYAFAKGLLWESSFGDGFAKDLLRGSSFGYGFLWICYGNCYKKSESCIPDHATLNPLPTKDH